MNFTEGLNRDQADGVMATGNCSIVACPGSGKTKTLANKAAKVISDGFTCCAVSFTKDSAIEMRERIRHTLDNPSLNEKLIAGTFHSLCLKQLGKLKSAIASEGDRIGMTKRALDLVAESFGEIALSHDEALRAIEQIKNSRCKLNLDDPLHLLYHHYSDLMQRNNKMDFQDLVVNAVEGMKAGTVKPYKVDYMLVDEFQDADQLQLEWVSLHAEAGVIVTVVGDDDQSIYGFRQALGFGGMEKFSTDFKAQRVVLGTNYRCHEEILRHAGTLIVSNKTRIPKTLVANKGPGGKIVYQAFNSDVEEADAVCDIFSEVSSTGQSYAILARNNVCLDNVEGGLVSHGIPYYRPSGGSFLNKYEVTILFDVLRFAAGKSNNGIDSALSWAKMPEQDLRKINTKFSKQLISGSKKDFDESGISDQGRSIWRDFVRRATGWHKVAQKENVFILVEGVREWIHAFATTDAQKNNINRAAEVLTRLSGSMMERLDTLSKSNRNEPPDGPHVVLTSMHSSKGLEWDNVWIVHSEETVIPDEKSSVEEERRLMYVAMTRARSRCIISSTGRNPVSRFVLESKVPTGVVWTAPK